jgi:2-C-methyl-D-erythritol 4-phosphate cytidylyltransferase
LAIWGVIPAAGFGERMQSPVPKQYLALQGQSLLLRSVTTLLANPAIDGVVVVLAANDTGFSGLPEAVQSRLITTTGGKTRAESVAAGVQCVQHEAGADAWALVHDAARPLLSARDLLNLISQVTASHRCGGLLAAPVQDTLKRADEHGIIEATVDRSDLWQAQTPQMFRVGALLSALAKSQHDGITVTDEASAFEHIGDMPLVVPAMDPNFKLTRPSDLALAAAWLASTNTPSVTSPD